MLELEDEAKKAGITVINEIGYASGEPFYSYSEMSQEGFLLRNYRLLLSLDTSALETCLGSKNSKTLPEEVIANSPLTDRSLGAAQFYISCAQLSVTKGGSGTPSPLVSPFL